MEGLKDDLSKVPSWVWFGTAAAGGLVYVLHKATSSGSLSSSGASVAPGAATTGNIGTPVAGSTDYSTTSALDSLSTLDQQILSALQNGVNLNGNGVNPVTTTPTASPPASLPTQSNPTIPSGWQQVIDPNSNQPIQTSSGAPFVLPTSWPQPTASPPAGVPIVQLQPIPLSELPSWASSPTFQFTGPPAGSGYVVLPGSTAANPLIGKAS
jgi:hypothetical protein